MTITQLQIFVEVAQTKSFTKAARNISLTQSAVSHAIANLETEFGLTLFLRSKTCVSLTAAGEKVYKYARNVVRDVEAMHQEMSNMKGVIKGKIRVGVFPSVAASLMPGINTMFHQAYPGIEIVLFEGTDFEVMEWIQSGTVDTGFVTLPNETFDTTYIIQDEFRFLIPSGHGLAQCASIDISQVASEPFIMSLGGCELFIREFFAENDLSPNVKYKVRDMATLIAMVREGLGISIAPTLSLPPKIENFVALSFKKPVYRKLALATRGNQDKLPVVEEFIEKIRSWVSISQLSKS